jgi:hypothetical protein
MVLGAGNQRDTLYVTVIAWNSRQEDMQNKKVFKNYKKRKLLMR